MKLLHKISNDFTFVYNDSNKCSNNDAIAIIVIMIITLLLFIRIKLVMMKVLSFNRYLFSKHMALT